MSCLENGQGFAKPETLFNVLLELLEMSPYMWDATSRRENCACVLIETVAWGPRRQLLSRYGRSKAMWLPQLGLMAAQAHYSLAFVNSSHMRREMWMSNLHWLRYSRVWQITFLSPNNTHLLTCTPHRLEVSPIASMCPVPVQRGFTSWK